MANILEDDKYYGKVDKDKWIWVEVDSNEPRDIRSKYMEVRSGAGFDPTKNMTTTVFKLVDRLEYEVTNNPERLEQLKKEDTKAWIKVVMKNMNLLNSAEDVEYFFGQATRFGFKYFQTSEYEKLKPEIKNDKELIKTLFNKGLDFVRSADKETQKQLVLENQKFLKYISGYYRDEFQELVSSNSQQVLDEEIVEDKKVVEHISKVDDKEEQIKEVMENPEKLSKLSTKLQMELLEQNPMLIDYVSYDVYYNNADFVNGLIAKEPRILQSSKVGFGIVEKHLKDAIEHNPFAIQYVEKYVGQSAYKYVKMAVETNPECLSVISKHLQISVIRNFSDGEELLKYATNDVQATMISRDASYLAYASLEVRNNDEVVCQAVGKNPAMYQYASDRLKDDIAVQKAMVDKDFNALDMLSKEQQQNPIFAEQKQKYDIVGKFRAGDIKLDDIDKQNFVDINFYNTIVYESKNKVLNQFQCLTQDLKMSDKIEEKLQETLDKKLKSIEKKLSRQRTWALIKNGIKTKVDKIKTKFNNGFEAGQVANEIKNMEL